VDLWTRIESWWRHRSRDDKGCLIYVGLLAVALTLVVGIGLIEHGGGEGIGAAAPTTTSTFDPTLIPQTPAVPAPTPTVATAPVFTAPQSSGSQVTQSYWYCWDTGPPAPHHLGHPVNGDHFCTSGELSATGFTP
jgi:hypothetical protein